MLVSITGDGEKLDQCCRRHRRLFAEAHLSRRLSRAPEPIASAVPLANARVDETFSDVATGFGRATGARNSVAAANERSHHGLASARHHDAGICAAAGRQIGGRPVSAFVNVNVIPMDREHVEPRQTVVVRGDRIVAIGATGDVSVPAGAMIIDGAGEYLTPGLTDAHVHLPGTVFAPGRPDFGDAPLYLAFGVTSVMNLGGTPTQLEWRRRIEAGELRGLTIYTAGEFVNEPRVNTIEDVEREVDAHVRNGYDMIKFREVMDPTGRFTATSRGLSRPVYRN